MWFQESNLRKPVRIVAEKVGEASKAEREITKNGSALDAKVREGLTLPWQQPSRKTANHIAGGGIRTGIFDDQVQFNFTDESRKFEVKPLCNCGFNAVLLHSFHNNEHLWKITCSRIRCRNETSPCKSRQEAVTAWTLLIKLTQ